MSFLIDKNRTLKIAARLSVLKMCLDLNLHLGLSDLKEADLNLAVPQLDNCNLSSSL